MRKEIDMTKIATKVEAADIKAKGYTLRKTKASFGFLRKGGRSFGREPASWILVKDGQDIAEIFGTAIYGTTSTDWTAQSLHWNDNTGEPDWKAHHITRQRVVLAAIEAMEKGNAL